MADTSQIPGPNNGIFGLKHIMDFQNDPLNWLMNTAQYQGDIVTWKFGPTYQLYMLTHPEYVRELLVKQSNKVKKWPRQGRILQKMAGDYIMVVLEGDDWKVNRKLVAPAFHTQRIKHYIDLIVQHTERLLDSWQDGDVVDIPLKMTEVTMGIIGEILFDIKDIEKDAAELHEALKVLAEMFLLESTSLMPVPDWVPTPRNLRENEAMRVSREYVDRIIQERRADGSDHGDVMSALLNAKDDETGETLTDEQIRSSLLGLFIAGHETTAALLTWTMYLLAKHPDVQEKMHAEVNSVMAENTPTLEDLATMNYTDQVMKESMRVYPPAWSLFLREIVEPVQIGEHELPAGHIIYVCPYVLHHDPRIWKEPQKFNPERFAGDYRETHHAYAFMPFGGGPRVCVASHLAEMEAEVIIATFCKRFTIELESPDQTVEPRPIFTLMPKDGLNLRVRKRQAVAES